MDDKEITAALAEVGAAWLMDDEDEFSQSNAIRHLVAAATIPSAPDRPPAYRAGD